MGFKDLFSKQSADYSKFRPTYPPELFSYLASLTKGHELAWDCGTGNGQAAVELAAHYKKVVATDPSEKQLAQAKRHERVEYRVGQAERAEGLADASVDLVTAAQAFHWFDHPKFFDEVRRVSKPDGAIFAVWSYLSTSFEPEVDRIAKRFYTEIVGPYWEPERKSVEHRYADIEVPFREIPSPVFEYAADWSVDHLLGYLGTWSATQAAARALGRNPVEDIENELRAAWGRVPTRRAVWDIKLRVFALT